MQLSTQFKIIITIFTIVLVVISASIFVTSGQIGQIRKQESLANSAVQGASELTYLSNYYVIYQESQVLSRWQARYVAFSNDIGNLTVNAPDQQALLQEIKASQQNMKTVFDSIVASIGTSQSPNLNATVEILQNSWSRMSIQSETLISDSTRLSQLLRSQVDQLNLLNIELILVAIATFSVFIVAIYLQTFRRTLRSISELRAGTKIIGSGNLDYKLKDSRKDEIGELSYEFNQMTANLKSTTAKLQDSERLATIGQTAGMVGHDIRNPLQAITGDLYLLKDEIKNIPDQESKQYAAETIDAIGSNIDYINKIVADLQDYARQTKPNFEELNLQITIRNVFSAIKIPSNIHIDYIVEPNLTLKTDPIYIKRILTNLATNAIQAMPYGGVLTIEARYKDRTIQITIADTGEGIPKDVQGKLFTPLFTTKAKGQGFGLAVVKKFVEQLGGTIHFESEVGKGTRFTVNLPK